MRPCLARVRGLIHAVAGPEVWTLRRFARADVDHVRIGRRDCEGADRSGRLLLENRRPDAAGIGGLPYAAIDDADIERVRLAWHAVERLRPARTMRSNVAPLHFAEQSRVECGRSLRRRSAEKRATAQCGAEGDSAFAWRKV